jgi:hypothetical protein
MIDWSVNVDTLIMITGLVYAFGGFGAAIRSQFKSVENLATSVEKLSLAVNELRVRVGLEPISHN